MGEAGGYPELVLYRANQSWAGARVITEPDQDVRVQTVEQKKKYSPVARLFRQKLTSGG